MFYGKFFRTFDRARTFEANVFMVTLQQAEQNDFTQSAAGCAERHSEQFRFLQMTLL